MNCIHGRPDGYACPHCLAGAYPEEAAAFRKYVDRVGTPGTTALASAFPAPAPAPVPVVLDALLDLERIVRASLSGSVADGGASIADVRDALARLDDLRRARAAEARGRAAGLEEAAKTVEALISNSWVAGRTASAIRALASDHTRKETP